MVEWGWNERGMGIFVAEVQLTKTGTKTVKRDDQCLYAVPNGGIREPE
jgi:hypothetical protein